MRLHLETIGAGIPVIILHGLFGSSDNWQSFARKIAGQFRVILADQRNHGRSPHADTMSYPEMAEDIRELMEQQHLPPSIVIGHSMGGKTAMQLALAFPDLVRKLVSVDIAPRQYEPRHNRILEALLGLNLSSCKSRQEMEIALELHIPDLQVRRFLLKGMRSSSAGFEWRMGISQIAANYSELSAPIEAGTAFVGPSLFVRGELSDYMLKEDEPVIRWLFPNAEFACVPSASHWVHADNPEDFSEIVLRFLTRP